MLRRVVVTGQGIVSSLGNNLAEVDESLRSARSGLRFNPQYAERGLRSQVSGRPALDLEAAVARRPLRVMGAAAADAVLSLQQALAMSAARAKTNAKAENLAVSVMNDARFASLKTTPEFQHMMATNK